MQQTQRRVVAWALALPLMGVLALGGCTWAGAGGGTGEGTVTVAIVANPQMRDIQELTGEFAREHPGITVRFVTLPENEARARITQDVATKAVPFYGESSFLMYRKDLFEQAGLTMPERPTWTQVAEFARALETPDRAGICLRGLPGWGEQLAPLNTVINTFGGRWYDEQWNAQLTSPATARAVKFYLDLVEQAGQPGAPNARFSECLTAYTQGQAALRYDATVAAGSLEDPKVSS